MGKELGNSTVVVMDIGIDIVLVMGKELGNLIRGPQKHLS